MSGFFVDVNGNYYEGDKASADDVVVPKRPTPLHKWVNDGWTLDSARLEAQFTTAIQKRLDDFSRTRNYDGILSACTYATSAVPKFSSEGQACVNLRDATWSAAYNILAQVQAGTRPMPASIADIEADLPALEWPQ